MKCEVGNKDGWVIGQGRSFPFFTTACKKFFLRTCNIESIFQKENYKENIFLVNV